MAFSQGPAFRVRGRSLARESDSDQGKEEEERTSSFEEQRASSNLANLDVSGFFINEMESGNSPRLDMSTLNIRGSNSSSESSSKRASTGAFVVGGGSIGDEDASAENRRDDDASATFNSTGSEDECFPNDDLDEGGSSSGSSGSSGFGSFYGTSVETVINARLSSVRRSRDHRLGSRDHESDDSIGVHLPVDVVKASGLVSVVENTASLALPRDRGDIGDFGVMPSNRSFCGGGGAIHLPLHVPSGGHVSRPRIPRGGRGSHGKPPLPTSSAGGEGGSHFSTHS